LVAVFCILLTAGFGVAHADWLTHRGNPQRTGAADDLPGPKSAKVLWVHKTREHFVAAPVPGGKEVYLSSLGAFNTSRFDALAVDPAAKKRIVWSKSAPLLKLPMVSAPALSGASSSSATACTRPTAPSCTASKPREAFRSGN